MMDPALFAPWFKAESWRAWQAFLGALFALPPLEDDLQIYQRHTARKNWPSAPAKQAWLVVGRRGGKSLMAALVAVFLACFRDYRGILTRGERGTVMVIAADRRQARVVLRYIAGFVTGIPMLALMVESQTQEAIHLANAVTIEVHTANFRLVRGYTVIAAICDEVAFWRSEESANPDKEILNGLRPGMATVPGALLMAISSPYARNGALWEAFQKHWGRDGDAILVWQADTRSMNPNISPEVVAREYDADPESALAEYGAEFRRDIESFISTEAVEAVVVAGRYELPPVSGVRYFAFVDPSGGSQDSMTLAVAHSEKDKAILDCVREKKAPFSPAQVVLDFARTLSSYRVTTVEGDRYGGEWPREQFGKHGIQYRLAGQSKSEIYLELVPGINSGQVELLDDKRLVRQLLSHSSGGQGEAARIRWITGRAAMMTSLTPQAAFSVSPCAIWAADWGGYLRVRGVGWKREGLRSPPTRCS